MTASAIRSNQTPASILAARCWPATPENLERLAEEFIIRAAKAEALNRALVTELADAIQTITFWAPDEFESEEHRATFWAAVQRKNDLIKNLG